MNKVSMDKIIALCKSRGFIFPGSEIYGGLSNSWDYGQLGVELKKNIKEAWWKKFVQESEYNVGLDSSILMNPKVWDVSGHLSGFNDPLMDCKGCKTRHRADKLIEEHYFKNSIDQTVEGLDNKSLKNIIEEKNIVCPRCGKLDFTDIRSFNLMFKTFIGVTEDSSSTAYLRPETAQGIFVNFKNVLRSSRRKIPFGIAQIGKSFRNEITPGNFIFRTREFEQMELQFFFKPGENSKWFKHWKDFCYNWVIELGLKKENLSLRDHSKDELSHYSSATTDIEYRFPFGVGELWGIADRGNYDLKTHSKGSGEKLEYTDDITGEKYIPNVIEPSLGVDRALLCFLLDAYNEETLENGDERVVLKLHPTLSPYKAAILPLSKKLSNNALDIKKDLSKNFMVDFDESGSIGKRYRRQDEIGTPYCITVDFETLNDNKVTIRDRDTMKQERIDIGKVKEYIENKIIF